MSKEIKNLGFIFGAVVIFSFLAYKYILTSESSVATKSLPTTSISMVGNLAASHSYSHGPIDAKVTIVEFFDPECESCAAVAPYIKNEMKFYEGKVRWVFRYRPYHHNSRLAIKVLEAARKQNKFLEVLTVLFENQKFWGEQQSSTEKQLLTILSHVDSLNLVQLKKDMADRTIDDIIATDESEGKIAGVTGTPTFFINGVRLEQLDLDLLIRKINELLSIR